MKVYIQSQCLKITQKVTFFDTLRANQEFFTPEINVVISNIFGAKIQLLEKKKEFEFLISFLGLSG